MPRTDSETTDARYETCENCQEQFEDNDDEWTTGENGCCRDCTDRAEEEDEYEDGDDDGLEYFADELHGKRATNIVDSDRLTKEDSLKMFGIEIESIVTEKFKRNEPMLRNFSFTSDGSISGGAGVEFVSTVIPNSCATKVVKNFSKFASKNGIIVDQSCGYHLHLYIHPDLQTVSNVKKILLGYMLSERLWYSIVPKSRRDNSYCYPVSRYFERDTLMSIKTLNEFLSLFYEHPVSRRRDIPHDKYYGKRYCWVNINSLFYRNTIEVRLFNGTTNWKKILMWYKLHKKFMSWCMRSSFKTLLSLENMDSNEIIEKVFSNKKMKKFIYTRRKKFLSVKNAPEGSPMKNIGIGVPVEDINYEEIGVRQINETIKRGCGSSWIDVEDE